MVSYTPKRARANCTFCSMAASTPVSLMTWATAATSSIHAGSKGADPGSTWNLTWECVILVGVLLVRKALHLSLSYKKSHFSRPSPVSPFYCSANNLVAHHVGFSYALAWVGVNCAETRKMATPSRYSYSANRAFPVVERLCR